MKKFKNAKDNILYNDLFKLPYVFTVKEASIMFCKKQHGYVQQDWVGHKLSNWARRKLIYSLGDGIYSITEAQINYEI